MDTDKKLDTIEDELKLLKGEVKESLASVRDYLLNMELPSSEFATVLAALGDGGGQKMTMKGSFTNESPQQDKEEVPEEIQEEAIEPESELPQEEEAIESGSELPQEEEAAGSESELPAEEEDLIKQDENLEPEDELPSEEESDEANKSLMPGSELPIEEESPMEYDKISAEVNQSTPKVNLMANLITWVARAKKEMGYERLPTLLEVYGISGHLSPELKEVILQLAEITSEQLDDINTAAVWSQLMLSLHGILTGNDAPIQTIKPVWHNGDSEIKLDEDKLDEIEVKKAKDVPVKLKLVFPNGDGKNQEFCLDLKPEVANNGSQEAPKARMLK